MKNQYPNDHRGTDQDPAIWLYPKGEIDVEIRLTFRGAGFMTYSEPAYNELWRIHVDPNEPFNRYSSTYVDDAWKPFLEYDGFRDGEFQKDKGWYVLREGLIDWLRVHLEAYGMIASEIDDILYNYGRVVASEDRKSKHLVIYPQLGAVIDASVEIAIEPNPDTIHRLWLYIVPTEQEPKGLEKPEIEKMERNGFSVIEFGFLTDREIPKDTPKSVAHPAKKRRMLGCRAGV